MAPLPGLVCSAAGSQAMGEAEGFFPTFVFARYQQLLLRKATILPFTTDLPALAASDRTAGRK